MGMYTEFVSAFELGKDTPKQVIGTLQYMLSPIKHDAPKELPNHELFQTTRWRVMLRMNSCYFSGDTHSTLQTDSEGDWYLTIRCNLKNYDEEIEKFISWIKPYVKDKGFVGYKRYEEDNDPTLIYI